MPGSGPVLQAYLLGAVPFADALGLQRRWVYEAAEDGGSRLLLCEHPATVTVGRHGSHAHLRLEEVQTPFRPWPVRWVNRAGGCWLQAPGQLAIYPVLPLPRLGLGLGDFLGRFQRCLVAVLAEMGVRGTVRPGATEVWVGDRPIASLGVAVRDWVTYHGAVLNLNPDLDWFRAVRTGRDHPPMTSLQRECRRPIRPALVREIVLEQFAGHFGFGRTALFSDHPHLSRKAVSDAIPAAG